VTIGAALTIGLFIRRHERASQTSPVSFESSRSAVASTEMLIRSPRCVADVQRVAKTLEISAGSVIGGTAAARAPRTADASSTVKASGPAIWVAVGSVDIWLAIGRSRPDERIGDRLAIDADISADDLDLSAVRRVLMKLLHLFISSRDPAVSVSNFGAREAAAYNCPPCRQITMRLLSSHKGGLATNRGDHMRLTETFSRRHSTSQAALDGGKLEIYRQAGRRARITP